MLYPCTTRAELIAVEVANFLSPQAVYFHLSHNVKSCTRKSAIIYASH
jgi:hypothetical protein